MKYSVGREARSGRLVTITKRDGAASVDVRHGTVSKNQVREGTVKRAKAAANTALADLGKSN